MANNQIALMAQTPVFDTPYESQGKALQLRSLMNQGQVQDMDMQQRRQAIADDQQTRDVYRNVSDPAEQIKALYKINPKAARDMQTFQQGADKSAADIGKIKADTQKTQSEVINQKMTRGKDMLNTVNDPQSAARWVQGMFSDPDMAKVFAQGGDTVEQAISRIPSDPQKFAEWKQQSQLGAEKLIQYTTPDANARLSAQTSLTTNATTNATTQRGQNMTAGTAAAGREQSATQHAENLGFKERALTGVSAKPLPTPALKMQQTALDAVNIASNTQADLGAIERQIEEGKLDFGLMSNAWNKGRNMVGASTEQSRNLSTFKSSLEKLRNDSLRLNTGVQTDGDAQRAWSELFENINDKGVVQQRLAEIKKLNNRAVVQHKLNVDNIRANYGKEPMDTSGYENQGAAVGAGAPAKVMNDNDYNALAPGASFVGPDGKTRRKP